MSIYQLEPQQYTTNIVCSKCKSVGLIVWEMYGKNYSMVNVSQGFYERISRKFPYPIELVCNGCGTAQLEIEGFPH